MVSRVAFPLEVTIRVAMEEALFFFQLKINASCLFIYLLMESVYNYHSIDYFHFKYNSTRWQLQDVIQQSSRLFTRARGHRPVFSSIKRSVYGISKPSENENFSLASLSFLRARSTNIDAAGMTLWRKHTCCVLWKVGV